jgi:GxxExxY protein
MSEISREASKDSAVASRYADVTYKIIGAAMDVHNKLGPGLKEIAYHTALSAAMRDRGLSYEDEKPLEVQLSGERVGLLYIDHFVEDAVLVEEKAFPHLLTNEELAQVLTYLAVTGAPLGLLINFGRKRLEYKRVLPPKKFQDWTERVSRYVWTPEGSQPDAGGQATSADHPLIRSLSADDKPSAMTRVDPHASADHPLIRSLSADDKAGDHAGPPFAPPPEEGGSL